MWKKIYSIILPTKTSEISEGPLLRIVLAMVACMVLLLLLAFFTYSHLREMAHRSDFVSHTYEVRLKSKDLIKQLIDIETGLRGYIITKNEHFLEPYHSGREKLTNIQKDLKKLVHDNGDQVQRLDSLYTIIGRELEQMEVNRELKRVGGIISLEKIVKSKEAMDSLRTMNERFQTVEAGLLSLRVDKQQAADDNMKYYLIGIFGLSFLFLLYFFITLYNELKNRLRLQIELENKVNELEHTNTELEQFAYITSHDLQEPLRKIRSFSDRIMNKQGPNLNEDTKLSLQKIESAAQRMQQLINDILMFSRANDKSEKLNQTLNLNEILLKSQEQFSEQIKLQQVTIKADDLPTIMGNETQMEQLFNNIIGNSIKYARSEVAPIIHISYIKVPGTEIAQAKEKQSELIYHQICFEDNGIGFEPQFAEKIFVIFQRLHNRTAYEGTGIGLALCRRIANNHNGFITAQPNLGKPGANFKLFLPMGN